MNAAAHIPLGGRKTVVKMHIWESLAGTKYVCIAVYNHKYCMFNISYSLSVWDFFIISYSFIAWAMGTIVVSDVDSP